MVNSPGKPFGKWPTLDIDLDTIGDRPVILWQKLS